VFRESTSLEHSTKVCIGVRTGKGVHEPLDCFETVATRVPLGKARDRRQNAFAPAINVSEFNCQLGGTDRELPKDLGGSNLKGDRLTRQRDWREIPVLVGPAARLRCSPRW
jgi:hypothetical protein